MSTAVRGAPSRRSHNGDRGGRVRPNRRDDALGRFRRARMIGAMLLAAAASAAWSPAASAQAAVGAMTGFSRASFTGGGSGDVVARTTFLIGGVGEIAFGEVSLRSELYFSEKGAQVETLLGDPRTGPTKLFRVPYVQLPLLVQLQTSRGGRLQPSLFGGLSVGSLLGCELADEDCDDIEGIGYRTVDFGVLAGAEVEWNRVGLGVRYEAGVRAVEASILGNELYNGVLSFTARYMFRRRAVEDG